MIVDISGPSVTIYASKQTRKIVLLVILNVNIKRIMSVFRPRNVRFRNFITANRNGSHLIQFYTYLYLKLFRDVDAITFSAS